MRILCFARNTRVRLGNNRGKYVVRIPLESELLSRWETGRGGRRGACSRIFGPVSVSVLGSISSLTASWERVDRWKNVARRLYASLAFEQRRVCHDHLCLFPQFNKCARTARTCSVYASIAPLMRVFLILVLDWMGCLLRVRVQLSLRTVVARRLLVFRDRNDFHDPRVRLRANGLLQNSQGTQHARLCTVVVATQECKIAKTFSFSHVFCSPPTAVIVTDHEEQRERGQA